MNETSPLKWNLFNPDEYEKARKWLEKIGLCLEPTRISKLLNITKEWNHVDSKQYTSDEVWGILELDDIYRIYKGLEQVDIKGFSDQLKKTLSGSVYIKDENVKCSSNKGRNYIFELYTASRFACSNFQIFFDSDADFNFKVGDYTFNVECKRVVSGKQLEKRISEGFSQAQKRCKTSSEFGVVAISLTKLVWDKLDQGGIVNAVPNAINFAYQVESEKLGRYIDKKLSGSNKVLIAILNFKFPVVDNITKTLNFYDHVVVRLPESYDVELKEQLVDEILQQLKRHKWKS